MMKELRQQVIAGFRPDEGFSYSHILPFAYSNFIDGMAWVSILSGSCRLVKDDVLADICDKYLQTLIDVGKDARNFAPFQVKDDWKHSPTMLGYWYKEKPQAFAGPCALYWAISCGSTVDPKGLAIPDGTARWLCRLAPLYGLLFRHISGLRQHMNSIMFAHLLIGKRPPDNMAWITAENMVYSYIYSRRCEANYPNTGAWPAKDIAFDRTEKAQKYTPTCDLAGRYMQMSLRGELYGAD